MKKILLSLLSLMLCFTMVGCSAKNDEGGKTGEDVLYLVALQQMNQDIGTRVSYIVEKYVELVNERGGVNSKKLVIDVVDSGDDQQTYINAIQKVVNTEGVDGIIGHFQGPWDIAAADIVTEAQIPTINLCCNRTNLELCEYYFITRAVTPGVTDAWAQLCIDHGMTHPIFLGQNVDNTMTAVEQFKDYYAAKGLTFTDDDVVYYDIANTSDWNPIVLKALEHDGDGIVISGTCDDDGQQLNLLLEKYGNTKPICLCEAMMDGKLPTIIGTNVMDGSFGLCTYSPEVDSEGNREWLALAKEWDLEGKFGSISWTDAVVYDTINIFVAGAIAGGDTTKEAVFEGLQKFDEFEGAMSSYTPNVDHCFNDHVYVSEFKDGKVVLTGETAKVVHSPIEW